MPVPSNPTLDWTPHFDPKSMNFRFAALTCWGHGTTLKQFLRKKNIVLDQGNDGACTGFGEEGVRATSPRARADVSNATAFDVYHEARRQDEWPGEDYEGSSVNGAMKAGRKFGYITGWHWAPTKDEARHGLAYHGAGEAGMAWMTGMFRPNSDGLLLPTGIDEGGHALCIGGFRTVGGGIQYRMDNSWNIDWGINGSAYMWEDDFWGVMNTRDGELAFPVKA